ncbi:diablo IAP-binding mitochondrial protein-like [Eucyclogobius newberryi]|uniref:diablo IAP-binding mitochondrial protein-like n=1 Tax=Eucyclogobius newberryi TaxID=166745 RepID=UPI003B5C495B
MAALWRWKAHLSVFRRNCRIVLTHVEPAAQKVGTRTALFTSIGSLAVGTTLCAVPFKPVETLSHDSLIRRAASLVTDSSSTFLSQSTLALTEAITQYSQAVHTLIALHRGYMDSVGTLSPAQEDVVWQVIIGQRSEINERREDCQRLDLTWSCAVRMCEVASEAAYSSGADQACVTLRTMVELALTHVEELRKLSADAEKLLTQTKVLEVERMAPAHRTEGEGPEEEEVPEAYLRED